jgi:hypothetical protein
VSASSVRTFWHDGVEGKTRSVVSDGAASLVVRVLCFYMHVQETTTVTFHHRLSPNHPRAQRHRRRPGDVVNAPHRHRQRLDAAARGLKPDAALEPVRSDLLPPRLILQVPRVRNVLLDLRPAAPAFTRGLERLGAVDVVDDDPLQVVPYKAKSGWS